MAPLLSACLAYLASWLQSRHDMQLAILALRHQLALYQRCAKRPPIEPWDRLFWSWLSRLWSGWKAVLPPFRSTSHRHRLAQKTIP